MRNKNLSAGAHFFTLFFTCCLLGSFSAKSQFTESVGGKDADYGQHISYDANGNVYIIGEFRGKADFDPGPDSFFLKSSCPCDESDPLKPDVFFAKYNKKGALVWASKVGGSGYDYGKSIGVDAAGNVYITGTFEQTADFDPSASSYNLTSNGGQDIFLAKYNRNGALVWAIKIGGASFDYGNALFINNAGITLAGSFNGNVDFDPTAGISNIDAGNSSDPFFARYTTNGNLVWVKDIAGSGESGAEDIFLDSVGTIYLSGNFFGTSDFDPGAGSFTLTGSSAKDAFYAKYDAGGSLLWADQVGGNGDQTAQSITADKAGDVYATGYYIGTVDFDPGVGTKILSTTSGDFNAYLLKLNSNGTFGWVNNIGGSFDDIGFAVAIDPKQNIYTTGRFSATAAFSANKSLTSAGSTDIYVAGYNTAGKLLFAKQAGGTTDDWASSMAIDPIGFVYLTGYYTGKANFNFGSPVTLTSVGNADVYISKFRSATTTTGIQAEGIYSFQAVSNQAAIDIFPNPVKDVLHIHIEKTSVTQIIITDVTGRHLIKKNIHETDETVNISMLHTGTYNLLLLDKNNRITGTSKIFKE